MRTNRKAFTRVQLPPPKSRRNLFHVPLTRRRGLHIVRDGFFI